MTKEMFVTEMVKTLEAVEGVKEVKVETITKINGVTLTGVCPIREGVNISPNIYAEPYFDDYKEGREIEDIMVDVLRNYDKHKKETNIDTTCFTEYEAVKDKIIPRLINAESNKDFLVDKPHRLLEDLAIMYSINLQFSEDSCASAVISNAHMEQYHVTEEDLYKVAVENLKQVNPQFIPLGKKLFGENFQEDEGAPKMYVISNEQYVYGASCILDKELLTDLQSVLGDSFFILPSSVHELLAMPMNKDIMIWELRETVKSVNTFQLAEQDRLSDNVYIYDGEFKVAQLNLKVTIY